MIIYNRTEYKALSTRQYSKEKKRLQVELLKLEEWVIKNNKRVGIVLEGRDAAGKGSTIKRFIENMMPKAGFGLGRKDCPQKVRFTSLIAVGIPEL
jgi:polyphosphate kinase 2 (PPK2 family)